MEPTGHGLAPKHTAAHTDLCSELAGKSKPQQRQIVSVYVNAFDSARPHTAEETAEYLNYLAAGDFNIFVAKVRGTHRAGVHVRVVETSTGQVGTIEQIWHGHDSDDMAHAVKCSLQALEWLNSKGCKIFIIERINPHMLATVPEIEGKRYSPGEETDNETVLEAMLESRSLEQESAVLKAIDQSAHLHISRIAAPYFQPDIWENGFSHGYFSLWIGSCSPQQVCALNISRSSLDDYLESVYPDQADRSSFCRRALKAFAPIPENSLNLIGLSEPCDQVEFDHVLQELRVRFLNGEIDKTAFEAKVILWLETKGH